MSMLRSDWSVWLLPMMQLCVCVCVSGEPVYEACRTKVEKLLYRKVTKAAEAADVDFYAFSYYYDRAVDLGLIGTHLGGRGRVREPAENTLRSTCTDSHINMMIDSSPVKLISLSG